MSENSVWVINTRAREQAGKLDGLIIQSGWQVVSFPVMKICPTPSKLELQQALSQLDNLYCAIFVSANAVKSVIQALTESGLEFPATLKTAAIGPGTAQALKEAGLPVSFMPEEQFNSEGLIDAFQKQDWMHQKVAIFRGQPGREVIQEVLQSWGAQVVSVQSYTRQLELNGLSLNHQCADFIVIPSVAVLNFLSRNLQAVPNNKKVMERCTAIAYSGRIAGACESSQHFSRVITAAEPTDLGVVQSIQTVLKSSLD